MVQALLIVRSFSGKVLSAGQWNSEERDLLHSPASFVLPLQLAMKGEGVNSSSIDLR